MAVSTVIDIVILLRIIIADDQQTLLYHKMLSVTTMRCLRPHTSSSLSWSLSAVSSRRMRVTGSSLSTLSYLPKLHASVPTELPAIRRLVDEYEVRLRLLYGRLLRARLTRKPMSGW